MKAIPLIWVLLLTGLVAMKLPAQTAQTLYTFNGSIGSQPQAALTQGPDGSFYGPTILGGQYSDGVIFKVTTNGTPKLLTTFYGADGSSPQAALVLGPDGNFYGTTSGGGQYSKGTVFKVATNGTLTTLVSFNGTNGASTNSLTLGPDGNFYGATQQGGTNGYGTVFQVTTNGTLTSLVSFNGTNGEFPNALTLGPDGNFYGTTYAGTNYSGTGNFGTVFKVTTNGTLTTLYSFNNFANGGYPVAALTFGPDGDFYGSTSEGGSSSVGTIFKMTTNGTMILSVAFNYNETGGNPTVALTLGPDGSFYGTTPQGGSGGEGAIFNLTTNGILNTLVSFNGANGQNPAAALTLGRDGNFYGTTAGSPGLSDGTVFVMIIAAPTITQPPQNQSNIAGQPAAFSVGAAGPPPLAYQWYFTNTNLQSTAGAVAQFDYGYVFGAVVTNGGSGYTVVPNVQFVGGGGQGAVGTVNLSNGMVLSINVTNAYPGYTSAPAVLIDPPNGYLIGQTNTTLNISAISSNNVGGYYVVISNSVGSITSSVATLTLDYPPSILQPPQSQVQYLGSNVDFSVAAGGTPPFSYHWWAVAGQQSNAAAVPVVLGGPGFVLAATITSGGVGYLAVPAVQFVGGSGSGAAGIAVVSNQMVIAINITTNGSGYATTPPTIQIAAPSALSLAGQTGTNLLLPAVTNLNAGNYYVVVTNNYGSVTSAVAALTVIGTTFLPPQALTLKPVGGGLSLQFTGTAYHPYTLETATNLVPPIVWQPILTNYADPNGGWNTFLTNTRNVPLRFYRAAGP